MSCHLHAATLADLARDVVIHSDVAAAARAHLAECDACTRGYDRERELTVGLRALAAATADARPSAAVRQRVIDAYASRCGVVPAHDGLRTWCWHPAQRAAAIAAALVVAIAAVAWLWSRDSGNADNERHPAHVVVAQPPQRAAGRAIGPAATKPANASRPAARVRRPRPSPAIEEFLPVPGSAAMPALESGRIVRVQLPLGALPSYGLDIAPGAAHAQVAADLLVGQDGHTRGIRLVR